MLSRIFSLAILIITLYILGVFLTPELLDKYGNAGMNQQIRTLKDSSFKLSTGATDAKSIFESIKNNAHALFEKTGESFEAIKSTTTEKVNQVKDASESVENAYNAIQDAKKSIDKLTGGTATGTVKP